MLNSVEVKFYHTLVKIFNSAQVTISHSILYFIDSTCGSNFNQGEQKHRQIAQMHEHMYVLYVAHINTETQIGNVQHTQYILGPYTA